LSQLLRLLNYHMPIYLPKKDIKVIGDDIDGGNEKG
jgi:hypothetical protein